jgi:carbamate kinase
MLIVAALGGNALLKRGEPLDAGTQRANVARAATALAPLASVHRLVITHGNGPQVGLLALQSAAFKQVKPYPLDVLGAESEGMIGYVIEQELRNAAPDLRLATLLTQVEVSPSDPAFAAPTKPVGPVYTKAEADALARERGWAIAPDGQGFRRVVASPKPLRILELETIRILIAAGVTVICTGGGGIPVAAEGAGVRGVEAVIDKDAASALLARELGADLLLMLTDVKAVMMNWGKPDARAVKTATPTALTAHTFVAGSMAPKIEAAIAMAAAGKRAAIGALEDAAAIVAGKAGTTVVEDANVGFEFW